MANQIHFEGNSEVFTLNHPENYTYLYFPVAGENGIKSSVSPNFGGDSKLDQNTFILEPVSAENLHNNKSTRNFWCHVENVGFWSAAGACAEAEYDKFTDRQDACGIRAGFMWQAVARKSEKYQLEAKITSFVPLRHNVEIMHISLKNIAGHAPESFFPTVEGFIGEGGSLISPAAVRDCAKGVAAGSSIDGKEAFGGVRMDGTNATIIGERQGEFKADRNGIARVWMDHGFWPFLTVKLYIDQTGDLAILNEKVPYFKDGQVCRGNALDTQWDETYGMRQKTEDGSIYYGSILEHILLQQLCAFYETGSKRYI